MASVAATSLFKPAMFSKPRYVHTLCGTFWRELANCCDMLTRDSQYRQNKKMLLRFELVSNSRRQAFAEYIDFSLGGGWTNYTVTFSWAVRRSGITQVGCRSQNAYSTYSLKPGTHSAGRPGHRPGIGYVSSKNRGIGRASCVEPMPARRRPAVSNVFDIAGLPTPPRRPAGRSSETLPQKRHLQQQKSPESAMMNL